MGALTEFFFRLSQTITENNGKYMLEMVRKVVKSDENLNKRPIIYQN
jgi:hypothetical protein